MGAETDQNFSMIAGERKVFRVQLTTINDETADLDTAGSALFGLAVYKTGEVKFTKRLGAGVELVLPDMLEITIDPEDGAGLSGNFVWDAKVWDALGNPSHVARGAAIIDPGFI